MGPHDGHNLHQPVVLQVRHHRVNVLVRLGRLLEQHLGIVVQDVAAKRRAAERCLGRHAVAPKLGFELVLHVLAANGPPRAVGNRPAGRGVCGGLLGERRPHNVRQRAPRPGNRHQAAVRGRRPFAV